MYPRKIRGFTLIELLTVIGVIAILAAILIPAVSKVRSSANNAKCVGNLRSISQAVLLYTAEIGRFPSNGGGPNEDDSNFFDIDILPYMGVNKELVGGMGSGYATREDANDAFVSSIIDVFQCPQDNVERNDENAYKRSYALVPWTFNWSNASGTLRGFSGRELPRNSGIPQVIVENPASAAVLVEFHAVGNYFGGLAYATGDGPGRSHGEAIHGENANVAFADGHVESFNYKEMRTLDFIRDYWGGAGIQQQ